MNLKILAEELEKLNQNLDIDVESLLKFNKLIQNCCKINNENDKPILKVVNNFIKSINRLKKLEKKGENNGNGN